LLDICIVNNFNFFIVTDKTDCSEESNAESNENQNEEVKKTSISDQFVFDF